MEQKLRTLYGDLYSTIAVSELGEQAITDITKTDVNPEYTVFTAMEGCYYKNAKDKGGNDFRLMLVGRAINGWGEYRGNHLDKEFFIETSMSNLKNEPCSLASNDIDPEGQRDRFDWINQETGNKNVYREGIDRDCNAGKYYISKSPFWSYSKSVWDRVQGKDTEWKERWFKKIVWSNLYKLSPCDEGNPGHKEMKIQEKVCIDLLEAEIRYFRPTHILFVTGWDWFEPFKKCFTQVKDIGRNVNKENDIYVEGTAKYDKDDLNCNVVVACRPEFRQKEPYVQQVSKYLSDKC